MVVDDHGLIDNFGLRQVEIFQCTGKAGDAAAIQKPVGGQHAWCGAYRGDQTFVAVLFGQDFFQGGIGGQVVRARQAAGQGDQIVGFPVIFA